MTTCKDIMKRIQKYDGVHLFLVLDKNGKKLNDDLEEEEKKVTQSTFNNNYSDIPKLVDKAISCVRDIEPLNELTFLQISYSGYDYLIAPDDDQWFFFCISTRSTKSYKKILKYYIF